MKSGDIKANRSVFTAVKERASTLNFYAQNFRVTHTKNQIKLLIKTVLKLDQVLNPTQFFGHDFLRVMSYCRSGSTKMDYINDQEIEISGVFKVALLREHLIAIMPEAVLVGEKSEQEGT